MYEFTELVIQEYLSGGKKGEKKPFFSKKDMSITIPKNYTGTELSVLPYGKYTGRRILLNAFYYNSKNERKPLNVLWKINNADFKNGQNEISPVESYKVICDYSEYKDSYYFITSSPKDFFDNDTKNSKIEFREATSNEDTLNYEVEFHRYIKVTIHNESNAVKKFADKWIGKVKNNETIKTIKINGKEQSPNDVFDNEISKLKVGDSISIVLSNDNGIYCNAIKNYSKTLVETGYTEYKFVIENNISEDFTITIKSEG